MLTQWELLTQKFEALQVIEKEIYDHLITSDVSDDEISSEVECADSYRVKYSLLKNKYLDTTKTEIGQVRDTDQQSCSESISGRRKFKLPNNEFKRISGDIKGWLPFLETVKTTDEGRYEVCLPWIDGHPPLPDNYDLARTRLSSTLMKLESLNFYQEYDSVFQDWKREGIIEEVDSLNNSTRANYLPHRPVIKNLFLMLYPV